MIRLICLASAALLTTTHASAQTTIGSNFCIALSNSTGQAATISATGLPVAAANMVTLSSTNLPTNTIGIFIVGTQAVTGSPPANSVGNLCVGGTLGMFSSMPQLTGATGQVSAAIDLTAIPQIGGTTSAVFPGDRLSFQFWFRDFAGMTRTTNFSNGVEIVFEPPGPSFASDIVNLFTPSCTGCHGASGGLDLSSSLTVADLLNPLGGSAGAISCLNGLGITRRVEPFFPDESALIHYLTVAPPASCASTDRSMLFTSPTAVGTIRDWIRAGALNN